jgi:protein ImuB
MRWACLLLPHLAIDAVLRQLPASDVALALVDGPFQRRVLHAVSPAAARHGLRRGMLLSAAHALTHEFTIREYDAKAEAQTRNMLATWAYSYSSQVSLEFPHALVLEVGASRALFGDWPDIERRLRSELTDLGFRHHLVAAPNPFAAYVLARVHDGLGVDDVVLERALGQIPIEHSGLAREVVATLVRSGLRTLKAVFALPRESIVRRFPREVLTHLDALRGWRAPPLTYFQPPDRFEQRIEFEYEVESSQALLFPLRRLTQDLATFLSSRDGGVQRFVLAFEHERYADSELVVGLLSPEREASILFELARNRLDQLRLPAGTRGMRLVADELPAFIPAARDLFDARPQQAVPWEQLRERLRARLGDDAVQALAVHADHRPERASANALQSTLPATLPTRPGWLLERPIPLHGKAQVLAGPERIEGGWWDDGEVRRDYYIVRTAQGQRAWAYTPAGQHGPLLLHGWFA